MSRVVIFGLDAASPDLVQRWARPEGDPSCRVDDPHCERCEIHGADCPSLSAPGPASAPSRTRRAPR